MSEGLRISGKARLHLVVTKKLTIAINGCLDLYFHALVIGVFSFAYFWFRISEDVQFKRCLWGCQGVQLGCVLSVCVCFAQEG